MAQREGPGGGSSPLHQGPGGGGQKKKLGAGGGPRLGGHTWDGGGGHAGRGVFQGPSGPLPGGQAGRGGDGGKVGGRGGGSHPFF